MSGVEMLSFRASGSTWAIPVSDVLDVGSLLASFDAQPESLVAEGGIA